MGTVYRQQGCAQTEHEDGEQAADRCRVLQWQTLVHSGTRWFTKVGPGTAAEP
jgi:hypothetical protein